jgi:hypothetical protein
MYGAASDAGVRWTEKLGNDEEAVIQYTNIRLEKTGPHAIVAVGIGAKVLAYDQFNITRSEERRKLARAAFAMMGELHQESWPVTEIEACLLETSAKTPETWESGLFGIVAYGATDEPEPVSFGVRPYIIQGAGTIFFAPQGSGKSYLLQSIALGIVAGASPIWDIQIASPVLYVNLERSPNEMLLRERALVRALGMQNKPTGVSYLNARGRSLNAVRNLVRDWTKRNEGGVIIDSISRSQFGDLNENQTGSTFIDFMHAVRASWWAAIGHTPRDNKGHLYGSTMYDAGADVMVKVSHDPQETKVGVSLDITKANSIGRFPTEYISLEFDSPDQPISRMERANTRSFPNLALQKGQSEEDRITSVLLDTDRSELSVGEIVDRTGMSYSNVSDRLKASSQFELARKEGRKAIYRLVEQRFSGEMLEK